MSSPAAPNQEGAGQDCRANNSDRGGAAWDRLREWVAEFNEEALLADGYEDAVIGVAMRCSKPPLVVYDADRCIEILMNRDGMDYDEAWEFFEFNTVGAWAGEHTPLFLYRPKIPCLDPAVAEEDDGGAAID